MNEQVQLLREMEWSAPEETCPKCDACKSSGHKPYCKLAEVLRRAAVKPVFNELFATAKDVVDFFKTLPPETRICSLSVEGCEWQVWSGFMATMRPDGMLFVGIIDDRKLLGRVVEYHIGYGK